MLLDQVDTQKKQLIQVWDYVKFVLKKVCLNSNFEFVSALHWQRLAPS
jgi:hypothetical protein